MEVAYWSLDVLTRRPAYTQRIECSCCGNISQLLLPSLLFIYIIRGLQTVRIPALVVAMEITVLLSCLLNAAFVSCSLHRQVHVLFARFVYNDCIKSIACTSVRGVTVEKIRDRE